MNSFAAGATAYRDAGLSVLPARRVEKRPAIDGWKQDQTRLPTQAVVAAWFANPVDACCLVCGAFSGHLEIIEFECAGEAFAIWSVAVRPGPGGDRDDPSGVAHQPAPAVPADGAGDGGPGAGLTAESVSAVVPLGQPIKSHGRRRGFVFTGAAAEAPCQGRSSATLPRAPALHFGASDWRSGLGGRPCSPFLRPETRRAIEVIPAWSGHVGIGSMGPRRPDPEALAPQAADEEMQYG